MNPYTQEYERQIKLASKEEKSKVETVTLKFTSFDWDGRPYDDIVWERSVFEEYKKNGALPTGQYYDYSKREYAGPKINWDTNPVILVERLTRDHFDGNFNGFISGANNEDDDDDYYDYSGESYLGKISYSLTEVNCCGIMEIHHIQFNFSDLDSELGLVPLLIQGLLYHIAETQSIGWLFYSNYPKEFEKSDDLTLLETQASSVQDFTNPNHVSKLRVLTFNLGNLIYVERDDQVFEA